MKFFLTLSMSLLVLQLFGQTESGLESGLFRLEKGTFDSHQLMIGRKLPPPEVNGDYYLTDQWQQGSFILKDSRKSATYPMRYDVENALLEIDLNGQIKVVGEELLSSFVWENKESGEEQKFINAQQFSSNETSVSGFVELLYAGKDSLLTKTEAFLKEPTYIEGLDMGKRTAEILKRERFFVCRNNILTEIKGRKDVVKMVEPPYRKAIKKFMKAEHIQAESREGLRSTWKFYESEVKN